MPEIEKHEKTLEELLKKVSDKNRELYQLNQEQEVLIKNIESLKLTVISMNDEIKAIDKIIADKQRQAEADLTIAVEGYKKEREALVAEFKRKDDDLSRLELDLVGTMNKNQLDLFEIKNRENAIAEDKKKIEADRIALESRRKEIDRLNEELKIKQDEFSKFCSDKTSGLLKLEERLNEKQLSFNDFVVEVNEKVEKANKILARINEVNEMLLKVEEKEKAIAKREVKVNEMQVGAYADMRRASIREEKLNEAERELKKREDNIKLAEENIIKG